MRSAVPRSAATPPGSKLGYQKELVLKGRSYAEGRASSSVAGGLVEVARPFAALGARLLRRLEGADRRLVIAGLVAGSYALTAVLALSVIPHRGWLYFAGSGAGGDSWTAGWAIVHGITPPTVVPYGLPVLYAPLALVAGPNLLAGLPLVVVLQAVLLAPVALVALFAIAERLGGRLFAYAATALWVAAPLLVLLFFVYPWSRPPFEAQALPTLLGLTASPAYPSMVIALVGVWVLMRALERGHANDAALAGLLLGFLVAIDPGNGFLLLAPALALPAARRWREPLLFAAAAALPLLVLLLWDAGGSSLGPSLHHPLRHLLGFRWSVLTTNLIWLRKEGWSLRIVEWLLLAGIVGALRRGLATGVLVAVWAVAFLVLEGGTMEASVRDQTYLPSALAGFPAYVILAACTVFLLPGLGRAQGPRLATCVPFAVSRGTVAALGLVVALPLALVAVARGSADDRIVVGPTGGLVPVSGALRLQASSVGGRTRLRWAGQSDGAVVVAYDVYRADDDGCTPGPASSCRLAMSLVAVVNGTSWTGAARGVAAEYRIGVVAPAVGGAAAGTLVLVSTAVKAAS